MILESQDGDGDMQLHHLQKDLLTLGLHACTLLCDAGRHAIEDLV
jgi:hypothetical protein